MTCSFMLNSHSQDQGRVLSLLSPVCTGFRPYNDFNGVNR